MSDPKHELDADMINTLELAYRVGRKAMGPIETILQEQLDKAEQNDAAHADTSACSLFKELCSMSPAAWDALRKRCLEMETEQLAARANADGMGELQ